MIFFFKIFIIKEFKLYQIIFLNLYLVIIVYNKVYYFIIILYLNLYMDSGKVIYVYFSCNTITKVQIIHLRRHIYYILVTNKLRNTKELFLNKEMKK